jgi:4-amino-4-deoxy-L-arabinose transferase-like glycosyltransferase
MLIARDNAPPQGTPSVTVARSSKHRHLRALLAVLVGALAARVLAAVALQWYLSKQGANRLCVFDDANYYWLLARTIRDGAAYQIVEWGTIAHKALRTPGYPAFLAACLGAFGEWPLGVRLVQAVLGSISVGLVYFLTVRLAQHSTEQGSVFASSAPLAAAVLAALNPYYIAMSELLLSEALFMPLMLATLVGLAIFWRKRHETNRLTAAQDSLVAIAAGAAAGAAILARPSFALFPPLTLLCWLGASTAARDRQAFGVAARCSLLFAVGLALVMSPWWIRNAQTYGRFIGTSVWFGASLYDGLSPKATGASDMRFMNEPDIRTLEELDQDRALTRRAIAFVRENPARAMELGQIKLGRYWSPWPNAAQFGSALGAIGSAAVVIPTYVLILLGAWDRRRDLRALILLGGPLVYFCAVHTVFVSSIRYRIPGEMVATALAGIGWQSIKPLKSKPAPTL